VVYVCDDDGYECSNPCLTDGGGGRETTWRHAQYAFGVKVEVVVMMVLVYYRYELQYSTLVCGGGYDCTNSGVKRERNELDLVSRRLYYEYWMGPGDDDDGGPYRISSFLISVCLIG